VDRPATEVLADPPQIAAVAAVAQPAQLEAVVQVGAAVHSANRFFKQISQNLEFSVDEGSGRTITRLVDKETNVVLRQFPSEEMLSIGRALDQLQGLLIRQKA